MKLLIIGDTHDNIANIKHVAGFAKEIDADAIIHTGDWCHIKSFEILKEYNIPIYSVLGNGDIDPELSKYFKESEEIGLGGLKIGIVHRQREIKKYFMDKKLDIIFSGHHHSQSDEIIEGTRLIRPGALENNINFAIFDTKTKMVEFVKDDQI